MSDINDYLRGRYRLSYSSDNIRILGCDCPYCGKPGKLYINQMKNLGCCHKCGRPFNSAELVSELEGCEVGEAFEVLKGGSTDDLDTWAKEPAKENPEAEPYFPPMDPLNDMAKEYLYNRGLTDKHIEKFRIVMSNSNGRFQDEIVYSRGRVVFPIFDPKGGLVSWQGRSMSKDSKVKYLFSPDLKKSEYLYNLHMIEKRPEYLILCEGVFDYLGWYIKGFRNVTASFGKMVSKTQVGLIKEVNPKTLFLALDYECVPEMCDIAGQFKDIISDVRMITLPEKDSDECSTAELVAGFKGARRPSWRDKVLASLA